MKSSPKYCRFLSFIELLRTTFSEKSIDYRSFILCLLFICLNSAGAFSQSSEVDSVEFWYLNQAKKGIENYRKGDALLTFRTKSGKPIHNAVVSVEQTSQDFLFGNVIFPLVRGDDTDELEMFNGIITRYGLKAGDKTYKPEVFKELFLDIFNLAIVPFYWQHFEPTQGNLQCHGFPAVIEWSKAHGLTLKGHPLTWPHPAGIPNWLRELPIATANNLLEERVFNVVNHFKDVQIWDATNEGVHHLTWDKMMEVKDFSNPRYYKVEMEIKEVADWIEKNIRLAYSANPQATLIINDYGQISSEHTRQRFYDLIKELQLRKVPISGIGLQFHPTNIWTDPREIIKTLDQYAELNCPVHITEIIQPAASAVIQGDWREGKWSEEKQAEYLEQVYTLFFGHPSVVSITYWGLSDRYIWQRKGGLIDENYNPKPAYYRLRKLIKEEWMNPEMILLTDNNGDIEFRGFYGTYKVTLTPENQQHQTFMIHLSGREANRWKFNIPIDW